jgi:hypothetical protein
LAKQVSTDHEIMTKPLPDIIDELRALITRAEAAALDAEGHSQDAKAAAAQAGKEAGEAVKKQIGYLEPRVTEAQDTAGKAYGLAKEAKAIGEGNTGAINNNSQAILDLSDAVKKLRKDLNDLGLAVVNGLKDYGRFIMSRVTFLQYDDNEK